MSQDEHMDIEVLLKRLHESQAPTFQLLMLQIGSMDRRLAALSDTVQSAVVSLSRIDHADLSTRLTALENKVMVLDSNKQTNRALVEWLPKWTFWLATVTLAGIALIRYELLHQP
jgi:hypothetical protein